MNVVIRPAGPEEIAGLAEIERDGDRRYAGYDGVPAGFDDVLAPSTLERARLEGRLWVATPSAAAAAHDEGPSTTVALSASLWPRWSTAMPTWPRSRYGSIIRVTGWGAD